MDKTFLDDMTKLAGSSFGVLNDMRKEVENMVREQVKTMAGSMDLVTREEFEAVKAMASKARQEQKKLQKRLDELEGTPPKKPAVKTSKK